MRLPFSAGITGAVMWMVAALAVAQQPRSWKPLDQDGIHDPASPAVEVLQPPAAALQGMPPDHVGNRVRWVDALRDGQIAPRTNILPGTEVKVLDHDVLMTDTAGMPVVLFPHLPHTEWLDCENCHDALFERKAGATNVSMFSILQGKHCGQCHGAVAFPLTECKRCHSVPRKAIAP
jgi:c(7)-type cytochrome triheme protein